MRRLPIFLLLDVSESMVGESHYQLERSLAEVSRSLRKSPYALETAYLSVIAFAGKARTIVPLTEIAAFQPPELPLGSGTNLGRALEHLMQEIDRVVLRTTTERKGDWKPLVFLMTDGHPTDDSGPAIERWKSTFARRANLVAVSIGGGADHRLLSQLTDQVLVFDSAAPNAFDRFIQWLSNSVETQSKSVSSSGAEAQVSLAKSDIILPLVSAPSPPISNVDDRYAVVLAKCARTERPYLMKFERGAGEGTSSAYMLSATVPVRNSYFELSDDASGKQQIASTNLLGAPACPHCAAPFGLAICVCGGAHCVKGDGEEVCPWCDNVATYRSIGEADEAPLINRRQG